MAEDQFRRYRARISQGEHVIVSGATGSGKTTLIPHIIEPRLDSGGFVVVFVMKPKPDKTIIDEFQGWTRWKSMKLRPRPHETKVLLWPDTRGMDMIETLEHQRRVFAEAFDTIFQVGNWTVVVDEGLYTVNPQFLNLAPQLAMLHSVGRSMGTSMITATQRPAHLPLIIYGSASHAFIGRTTEAMDLKRLSELNGSTNARSLGDQMSSIGKHDFIHVNCRDDDPPEVVNLRR